MMFYVLVRNKACCPMGTFKEGGKTCTVLVVRAGNPLEFSSRAVCSASVSCSVFFTSKPAC